MKTHYKLAVTGIKSDDLSSLIDLVHDIGGEVADFSIERSGKVRVAKSRPATPHSYTLNADRNTKRSRNLRFKLGSQTRIRELELVGGRNTVVQLAKKYAATQPHGVCKRAKFQSYVIGHDTGLSDSGISPTVSLRCA